MHWDVNQSAYFEEFYLAMLLRSVFIPGETGYVDFRSPARYGSHYMVIDYDGTLYPTDEARMLSRTRHVDLSLGNLETAFDTEKAASSISQQCTRYTMTAYTVCTSLFVESILSMTSAVMSGSIFISTIVGFVVVKRSPSTSYFQSLRIKIDSGRKFLGAGLPRTSRL